MITNILCTSNVYTISITKPLLVFINSIPFIFKLHGKLATFVDIHGAAAPPNSLTENQQSVSVPPLRQNMKLNRRLQTTVFSSLNWIRWLSMPPKHK